MFNEITVLSDTSRNKVYNILAQLDDRDLFDIASLIHECLLDCKSSNDAMMAVGDVLKIIQQIDRGRTGYYPKLREVKNLND